ncbi:MAG: hypothetical protein AAF288_10700 [Planctomycetota bacterium]
MPRSPQPRKATHIATLIPPGPVHRALSMAGKIMALLMVLALIGALWPTSSGNAHTPNDTANTTPPAAPISADGLAKLDFAFVNDPIWYDGQAEQADYDATRSMYGQPRQYVARFFTNKEPYSPATATKAAGQGIEVFKFHVREDLPTKNYTYHYSTMAYVQTDDLSAVKLQMGSNEDCGATFKEATLLGNLVAWRQSSYFPNEGVRQGSFDAGADLVFHDALPLVLRGYPFADASDLKLRVVPEATTTHLSPVEPVDAVVRYVDRAAVKVPAGTIVAHQLEVAYPDGQTERYWFDADPRTQHVMVQAETGVADYALRSVRRWAYWSE